MWEAHCAHFFFPCITKTEGRISWGGFFGQFVHVILWGSPFKLT